MSDLGGIPPELAKLYAAERASAAPAVAARAGVRAKLAASVGAAPLGHAAAAATLGTTGKIIATVAIVAGIGGGTAAIVHAVRDDRPRTIAATVTSKRVTAQSPAADPVPAPPPPPAPHEPEPALQPPARATRTVQPNPPQQQLLRDAWSAMSTSEPTRALELVELDARVHRGGSLAEEREALRVIALAQLHRDGDAQAAASQFFKAFPSSMYGDRVRRAITNKETP